MSESPKFHQVTKNTKSRTCIEERKDRLASRSTARSTEKRYPYVITAAAQQQFSNSTAAAAAQQKQRRGRCGGGESVGRGSTASRVVPRGSCAEIEQLRLARPEAVWCPRGRVRRSNRRVTTARTGTVQKGVSRVRMHPLDGVSFYVVGERYVEK